MQKKKKSDIRQKKEEAKGNASSTMNIMVIYNIIQRLGDTILFIADVNLITEVIPIYTDLARPVDTIEGPPKFMTKLFLGEAIKIWLWVPWMENFPKASF